MSKDSLDAHIATVTPPRLSAQEVDALLELRLIANLATLDRDGRIHLVPMWFRREGDYVLIPTSRYTRKFKNVRRHPHASVMIDQSGSGMDIRGVLIRGRVELVEGDDAKSLNRSIHLRYVTPEGLDQPEVVEYLTEGDDVTLKVAMEEIVTWNHADSAAGRSLSSSGHFHPLDD